VNTQVAIIGAGPAGLLLGHLLTAAGIDCVILEQRDRARVESRIRAGVLETVTTDLMRRLGVDARMNAEGLVEGGFNLAMEDRLIRIDLTRLTGKHVTVYGQTEMTRDLIAAAPERGLRILFEAKDVGLRDIESDRPSVGRSTPISLQAATASTGRPARRSRARWRANSSANIRLAGSASLPTCRPVIPS
jgi:p-hydroxybenzoate 3-monooxygenase